MRPLCFLALIVLAIPLLAGDTKLPLDENSNENINISGTLILGREQVRQALGVTDIPNTLESLIVVRVSVRPLTAKPMNVSLDDFTLLCTKDGQRSKPFEPSEIAGASTLVLRRGTEGNGKTGFGGGFYGIGIGNAAPPETVKATVEEKNDEKESPMMASLKAKILPQKETLDPVSGLLYFEIDGNKLKPKDFELLYHGPGGRLAMRFRP
ncbi:MAG TPA: hypothetical protein VLT57_00995 [Bryobacteraceae bacterium]|nr:hypothetical protein [Bryobacteraceae bacterium]